MQSLTPDLLGLRRAEWDTRVSSTLSAQRGRPRANRGLVKISSKLWA